MAARLAIAQAVSSCRSRLSLVGTRDPLAKPGHGSSTCDTLPYDTLIRGRDTCDKTCAGVRPLRDEEARGGGQRGP